jgi:hypothetical protein
MEARSMVLVWLVLQLGATSAVPLQTNGVLHSGQWTFEAPSGAQTYGQYVYASPMGRICNNNLTIHIAESGSYACSPVFVDADYFESNQCIPDVYEGPAWLIDQLNGGLIDGWDGVLADTCFQLSANHYDPYESSKRKEGIDILDATRASPKHGIVAAGLGNGQEEIARAASLVALPYIESVWGGAWIWTPSGSADRYLATETYYRTNSDLSWTLPGSMDLLPEKFAVFLDNKRAGMYETIIREEARKKNKTIALTAFFNVLDDSNPAQSEEAIAAAIEQVFAKRLRYLLVASEESTMAAIACVLYKMNSYRDVQVVAIGQFCENPHNYMSKTTCEDKAVGDIVVLNGGWFCTLPQCIMEVSDDIIINRATVRDGISQPGSYDVHGNPWKDNGLHVLATSDCFDDEEGLAQSAPLRLLTGKKGDEILTCSDLVPFGQSRMQAYVQDVAELCPIASCKYNSVMPACRISCACRLADELTSLSGGLRFPGGSGPLCSTVADLPLLPGRDEFRLMLTQPNMMRCEGKSCRPLAYANSSMSLQGFLYPNAYDTDGCQSPDDCPGFCPPPYECSLNSRVGAYALFPGLMDGIYAFALAYRCMESRYGAQGLADFIDRSYGDNKTLHQILGCLNEVEFEGFFGRINFKYFRSPTPGYTTALVMSYRGDGISAWAGTFFPDSVEVSRRVVSRSDYTQCSTNDIGFLPG